MIQVTDQGDKDFTLFTSRKQEQAIPLLAGLKLMHTQATNMPA